LGVGEEKGVAEGGVEGRGVPAGLHEAGGRVGVGAEKEVADFVRNDEAEHVAVGEPSVFAIRGEIVVIDVGVDAAAGIVEEGLAEDVRADGTAVRKDANGKLMRPADDGAGRHALREIRWIGVAAAEPVELDAGLSKDCGGSSGGLGQDIGGNVGIVEDGEADADGGSVQSAGGSDAGGGDQRNDYQR